MSQFVFTTQKQKQKNYKDRPNKITDFKDLRSLSKKLKSAKKSVVFTTGSYDLLNPGHCRYLAEAKVHGDVLVVGVSTDESDSRTHGEAYPFVNEKVRAEMVSFLRPTDFVITVDEVYPHGVLALLKPDVFFTYYKSWENGIRDEQEKYLVESGGGRVVIRDASSRHFGANDLVNHVADIRVIRILEDYLKEKVKDFHLDPESDLRPVDYGDQKPKFEGTFDPRSLIVNFSDLAALGEKYRKRDKTVAFVAGSYDLLHVGHARFIEQAGVLADILVVGIPSDKSLRRLKGVGRPVICEHSRALVLGHLDCVNHMVIFDDDTVMNTLEALKPDIFFTVAEEWNNYKASNEYKLVKSYGGKVVASPRQAPFISASAMIDKMALGKVREIFKECMDEERYARILQETARKNGGR